MRRILILLVLGGGWACDDGGGGAASDSGAPLDGGAPPAATCPESVPEGWACAPAGTFMMGAISDDPSAQEDETRHEVTLSRPFLVRTTELTQGEWLAHIEDNPAWFRDGGDGACLGESCLERPVEQVSYYEALAWCNAASEAEGLTACYDLDNCSGTAGLGCEPGEVACVGGFTCAGKVSWDTDCDGYRLPTEAEWEYAARAGSQEIRYGLLADIAWHLTSSRGRTHRVGELDANAWGLFDSLGNVAEWTWDIYDRDYGVFEPDRNPQTDPQGAAFGDTRVIRGCAWDLGNQFCRASAREKDFPTRHRHALGFRPVRTVK